MERRLNIEHSLKKSWGKLKIEKIVWNTEQEIILLVVAERMPGSMLLFDMKLKKKIPDQLDYFTRTGIPKPDGGRSSMTDREAIYFADRSVPVSDSIIVETVSEVADAYNTFYYSTETGNIISKMLTDNLDQGRYGQITRAGRLADSITRDIQHIQFDRHSWVEADRRLLQEDSIAGPSVNYGIGVAEILKGNTGYLKINEFSPLLEAQDMAARTLGSLSGCTSLILDLRNNYGGYPEMIEFLSGYFFPVPVRINTLYDRNGKIAEELWTRDSIPGERFPEALPVVILTSKRTASAAEGFVHLFRKTGRAVIIGESTNGAHHPAKEIVINSLFVVSVPFLSGEDLNLPEGQGITPDISVPEEAALEKALEYLANH